MRTTAVLVAGGAGFIGSHLVEQLLLQKHRVTVADDLSRGSLDTIAHLKSHLRFLRVDLRDMGKALEATKGQDVVYNLAALNTGVDYDAGRTQKMFEENMLLQMMPLRAAAENRVKTFVQISSASVYSQKTTQSGSPIKEMDDHENPEPSKLGYAQAKRMGEKLAYWYASTGTIKTAVARFTNVYGPRDHYDNLGHFIPVIVKKFYYASNQIEVFGSGRQKRSFLHVRDAARALLVLARKGESGQVYNIDPQDEHSVREIVYAIGRLMKKEGISVVFNTQKPEGSKRRVLDSTKIRLLGWKPQNRLIESLSEVVEDIVFRLSHEHP